VAEWINNIVLYINTLLIITYEESVRTSKHVAYNLLADYLSSGSSLQGPGASRESSADM